MKRLMLAAVVISSLASLSIAEAGCTAANRGGSAGPYDTAQVSFGGVTIDAEQYGNSRTGPAYLCSDGTAGAEPAPRGKLEIRVDGDLVCSTGQRLATDPFGFGAEVHSPAADPCGADITINGLMEVFSPDPGDVHAEAEAVSAGIRKNAPATGSYWYGGTTYTVPANTRGFYTRGIRVASEH